MDSLTVRKARTRTDSHACSTRRLVYNYSHTHVYSAFDKFETKQKIKTTGFILETPARKQHFPWIFHFLTIYLSLFTQLIPLVEDVVRTFFPWHTRHALLPAVLLSQTVYFLVEWQRLALELLPPMFAFHFASGSPFACLAILFASSSLISFVNNEGKDISFCLAFHLFDSVFLGDVSFCFGSIVFFSCRHWMYKVKIRHGNFSWQANRHSSLHQLQPTFIFDDLA